MKRRLLLLLTTIFALSLFLVACGDSSDAPTNNDTEDGNEGVEEEATESSDADAPKFLSFLTGGTSGTYYPLGGAIAKIISDETGIQTDALSSNASADNIIALKDGEAELAFTQTDVAAYAVEGINAFDGDPVDNVLALGSLYPETVQIVTTENSGITSVEDLAGKKVSVGAPGSGTYINAEQILEIHGMTMDDIDAQNLDFGESAGGIKDGNIDAAFITAGTPTGAVEELQATSGVYVLPIAQDKIDALIEKYPFYAADTIPEGTYGLAEDINTVAVFAMVVVTDNLSEDVVYNITKALYENSDAIAHAKAEFISLDNALEGIGFTLHPGAKKYFEEEGLEID